ncbi:hypothetical protein L1049_012020 [Liquidambar formosana]|uniref:Lysine-specific demethylase ELF6 n=1 Tax=Liquidambar formosana TaxID=63359 RepID=A0AAP0RSX2_LIQFO
MRDEEIPNWLEGLPLAPEFRPTDTEFADPIAYISKIEKHARAFGICKVIPPLPKPSKKYVLFNLNKSLSKCPELGSDAVCSPSKLGSGDGDNDGEVRAVFTTRHQELGHSTKRNRGAVQPQQPPAVHKQVWQSGSIYTLEQFETKSKAFARNLLGMIKEISPLVIEAMFWKAASEKPIYVEYANDVPGSGFGEPEGPFRYFHKRRRKRVFKKSSRESFVRKKRDDSVRNSPNDENKDVSDTSIPKLSLETSMASSSSPTMLTSRQKSSNSSNEMEGTAGWKLSNSPWNLQVIARSPGSLTRFMPDDIPGVTSPMIYIGMLFSWFAWHVEDHELHSLNFLHCGSPKTWYAVPGDYAFTFEEVIRNQAYGGNVDRLAALTLLGEKTTLLSPEVVVASGIPCCRLIQNPGEFVVTFPRAYHVGFSHGFNCGEAANFGTPEWVKVAKEAAVRRAAMNYLPMLSHQQLLYLLTMSFVSRVPRSLLPGARSSRLRDRQKEERELSVKKAFIEDMLNENNLLTVLLGKGSIFHAVLWDPESLPSPSKESQLPSGAATVDTMPGENVTNVHSENDNNQNDLFDEMSLYMETVNDLYLDDDDDLSCDFQVDSGTLACVACGILGFPFMSVVQPSERASMELLPADQCFIKEGTTGISKSVNTDSSSLLDGTIKDSISENLPHVPDHSLPPKDLEIPSITKFNEGWTTSCGFMRPRIFCLEHAVQIEELLQSKGGAKMLVICHSDYQKIKAHAAAVAEEIGSPFNYNEIPLDTASQEDLNLINLAIDEEDHDERGEEWTSELGINLRYCVKVRKNSPSKQVQHALALGGLFSDTTSNSNFLNLKWRSRRSRSKHKSKHSIHSKPCESIHKKKDEALGEKLDGSMVRKEEKLIQYSRRNFKFKRASSTGASGAHGCPEIHLLKDVSAGTCGDLDKHSRTTSEKKLHNIDNTGVDSSGLGFFASVEKSQMQHEILQIDTTRDLSENSVPAPVVDSLATPTPVVGRAEAQIENQTLKEMNMGKAFQLGTWDISEMQHEIKAAKETSEKNEIYFVENCDSSLVTSLPTVEDFEMHREDQIMEEICTTDKACNLVTLDNGDVCDRATLVGELQQEIQTTDGGNEEEPFSSYVTLKNQPTCASRVESCEVPGETCAAEDLCNGVTLFNKVQQEIQTTNISGEEKSASRFVTLVNQPTPAAMEESSDIPRDIYAAGDTCSGLTLDNKVLQGIQTTNGSGEEEPVSSYVALTNQPTPASVDESSEVRRDTCAAEDLCNGATLENEMQRGFQTTHGTNEEPVPSSVMLINQPTPASVSENAVVVRETCACQRLGQMCVFGQGN